MKQQVTELASEVNDSCIVSVYGLASEVSDSCIVSVYGLASEVNDSCIVSVHGSTQWRLTASLQYHRAINRRSNTAVCFATDGRVFGARARDRVYNNVAVCERALRLTHYKATLHARWCTGFTFV